MKKIVSVILLVIFIFSLTGCGADKEKKAIVGTWYSTRPDTLIISEDNKFASQWITSGVESTYIVEDGKIIFTAPAPDKSDYEFKIIKNEDKVNLHYESKTSDLEYTYYMDKKFVDEIVAQENKKAQEEKEQQEKIAKEEIADILVGNWEWVGFDRTIEFTSDGEYKFTNYKDNVWNYKLLDSETLEIKKDNGEIYTTKIKITKIDNEYELIFSNSKYLKK